MSSVSQCCQSFIHRITSKTCRVCIMFVLTIATATFEIVYGVRTRSNSLIADGLYSFAEGVCLIGVALVLHYSHGLPNQHQRNTFGYERLELLFGLIQEVFLLSVSLGVIVDAVNHLVHPVHVQDPVVVIILGVSGIFIGLLGIAFFWGYHHNHDIEEEIIKKKKEDFVSWTKKNVKNQDKPVKESETNETVEVPLMKETTTDNNIVVQSEEQNPPHLATFTYENVNIKKSRVYATLHALCLHSVVILLESCIVIVSGLMVEFIPHKDPVTGKEINVWLKYADPVLTLIMVAMVAIHASPVIFSISAILIENVPDGIDTQNLMKEIIAAVPEVKSIHSFHIWRATAKEIYATLHLVCDEDVMLSTCTHKYGKAIQKVLNDYCITYFTLQFEHATSHRSEQLRIYDCTYGVYRKRRGHTLDESVSKLAKDAILRIQ